MSLWPPRSRATGDAALALALDARQLAWAAPDAASGHWRVDALAHGGGVPAAVQSAAAQLRRRQPGARALDVVVGADLAHHWLQTPPAAVASLAELRQIAQARRAHLFGPAPGGTADAWWIAGDWDARRPFVCAALPASQCADVHQALADAGLAARWHTPWSLLAQRPPRALPGNGWCALRSASRLLVWHCTGGQVDALLTLPASPHETADQAAGRAWQSVVAESTGAALPTGDRLHWLDLLADGAAPSHPQVLPVRLAAPVPPHTSTQGHPAPQGEAVVALHLHQLLTGSRA